MIRAAFFGTPEEAVPVLVALTGVADVGVVVTRRDRPKGRSGAPVPPPVKLAALDAGIEVLQPGPWVDVAAALEGTDVAVLAAYGRLIPSEVLAAPRRGFVNVHFSLLPRWRGASPVVRAILAGDAETGVTLMEMDEGFDSGRIIATRTTPIDPTETTGELTMRLAELGGAAVADVVGDWVAGSLDALEQDPDAVTAAAKVTVAESFLAPRLHAAGAVLRAVRAFNPKPGAWGVVDGERLKVWRATATSASSEPGVASLADGRVILGCSDGSVELQRVQPAGRSEMDAIAWMNGRRGKPAHFGQPD